MAMTARETTISPELTRLLANPPVRLGEISAHLSLQIAALTLKESRRLLSRVVASEDQLRGFSAHLRESAISAAGGVAATPGVAVAEPLLAEVHVDVGMSFFELAILERIVSNERLYHVANASSAYTSMGAMLAGTVLFVAGMIAANKNDEVESAALLAIGGLLDVAGVVGSFLWCRARSALEANGSQYHQVVKDEEAQLAEASAYASI